MKFNYAIKMITLAAFFALATQASADSNLDFSRINSMVSQTNAIKVAPTAPSRPLQLGAFDHIDSFSRFNDRAPSISDIKKADDSMKSKNSLNSKFITGDYDSK